MGNFAFRNLCVLFFDCDSLALSVHAEAYISFDEVFDVFDRVYACVTLFADHETFERSNWFGLRCVSFMHFVYFSYKIKLTACCNTFGE